MARICGNGNRVGSPTALQFAADNQPLLGCIGHIHESPYQIGGNWNCVRNSDRILYVTFARQPGGNLLRLHNEVNYATLRKRKNEAIQTKIPPVRGG